MNRGKPLAVWLAVTTGILGCHAHARISPRPLIERAEQLVVVTTPGWTSTTGSLQLFERGSPDSAWRPVDSPIPVVVGRTGIAWGVGFGGPSSEGPHKHEGDGKAPAGVFPL
ncbi:MAG TPA: hypothetical protein VD771_05110, partial [Gemmatimonadaceae bacterium]|nr:hypothetical protein [Gemmatimonadaceae bacterium]